MESSTLQSKNDEILHNYLKLRKKKKKKKNILLKKKKKIEIKTLYKPNQKLYPLFYKYIKNFEPNKHYDLKVCKSALISYLKEKNLFTNEANLINIGAGYLRI